MCFSSSMSLFAFITGIIGCILVYSLGGPSNKILALFIGFVAFMQFIEYLLWNHQKCDNYNKLISKIGMWLNHLQPIVLGLLVIIFNPTIPYFIISIIILLYLCVIIPYSLQYKDIGKLECTIKNLKTDHLKWVWNYLHHHGLVYALFLLAFVLISLYGLPNKELGIYAAIVAVLTFFSSAFIYKNHVGSMWCFYTVFIPILYYLYCKTFNKFINT